MTEHVMIDIETMATTPDAAIVSIGAVMFDPTDAGAELHNTFYVELDWQAQGRRMSLDTLEWWQTQNAVNKHTLNGTGRLDTTLFKLSQWFPRGAITWANSPSFDLVILEDAYRSFGQRAPWAFWDTRDCRTIEHLAPNIRKHRAAHNALEDAKAQAERVTLQWQMITNNRR